MFSSITKIIKEANKGKIFILVDDENRENEADLVIPANKVKHKDITFMAKYGSGLICLALDTKQVKKLNLQLMSPTNQSRSKTAFTVSIDAAKNITTGISAHDRTRLRVPTIIRRRRLFRRPEVPAALQDDCRAR